MTSEQIPDLAAALSQAQAEFTAPKKSHTATVPTKAGGSYSYKYSTLDELIDATGPALAKHGLSIVQNVTSPDGGTVAVSTVILHSSGQRLVCGPVVLPSGTTPQTLGASITYGRRYSLGAALNVVAEDDDDAVAASAGNGAKPRREAKLSPPEQAAIASGNGATLLISRPQITRFFAIAKAHKWADDDLKRWLKDAWGLESSREIPRAKYDEIIKALEAGQTA